MELKFIDLFAGVGGIRLGFEQAAKVKGINTDCVFTSEIDKYACKVYRHNYNDNHNPENDITKVEVSEIDDFDILLAGFPCQAFSIAGRRGGFEDTRGTLFFDVARIIKAKRPKAFLLENVKGLVNHKKGKTLKTILHVLETELDYNVKFKVLNARNYGVPQNRERIYIVGFRDSGDDFTFPLTTDKTKKFKDVKEKNVVSVKYYLSNTYLETLIRHKARHEKKGNGFGYAIIPDDAVANAILVGGMGKERNLVLDHRLKNFIPVTHIKGEVNRKGIRKMTPLEWERLQGFPDGWTSIVSDAQRYKQMGNSVAVPVINAVINKMLEEILEPTPFKAKRPLLLEFPA